jgi:hypothetical protein
MAGILRAASQEGHREDLGGSCRGPPQPPEQLVLEEIEKIRATC